MSFIIAKQPIFNKEGKKVAFEVFLRKKDNIYEYPKEVPYNRATYKVVEILLEQGINKIGEGKRVMINVSLDSILNKVIETLNMGRLIIEILEPQLPLGTTIYNLVLNIMDKYAQQGVLFCIDEKYLRNEKFKQIFEKVHIISVSVDRLNEEIVKIAKNNKKLLLISKIENEKQYNKAIKEGDLFQGIYLESPTILKEFELIPYLKSTMSQVLALLHTTENIKEIAKYISMDVGLTAKIFRFANSTLHLPPSKEIRSIEHVCEMLGLKGLKNFFMMLSTDDYIDVGDPTLWKKSLVRALIAQKLAEIMSPEYESEAYLMGLFSLIDKILFVDKLAFLKEIKITQEVIDGYTGKNQVLRKILDYSILIEEKFSELKENESISKWDSLAYLRNITGIEEELIDSIAESAFSMADYMLKI